MALRLYYFNHCRKGIPVNKAGWCGSVSCLHTSTARAGPQENPFVPSPLKMATDGIVGCVPAKNCCPSVVGRSATT